MKQYLILFLVIFGCKNVTEKENSKVSSSNIVSIDDVLINDKKILLTLHEFNQNVAQIDSTKTTLRECGNPFEWLDKQWMENKYGKYDETNGKFKNFDGKIKTLYVNDVEYDCNNHLVLFNKATTANNSFKIVSKNILLNANTTIEQFQKYFPETKQENLKEPNQFRFRLHIKQGNEDAFLFDFKNGKLQSVTLWWLLC